MSRFMKAKRSALSAVAFTAVACLAHAASAEKVIDVGGFEAASGYSTGGLVGQVAAASLPNGTFETIGSGDTTATVQDTVFAPGGGTQAVELTTGGFSSAFGSGDFFAIFLDPADRPTTPIVVVEWDMLVDPVVPNVTDPDPGVPDFGPIFGVNPFDESGGAVSQLGSLVVDASTGEVLFQTTGTGFLSTINDGMGGTVTVSGWNTYSIILDFVAETYTYTLNGVALGTESFIDVPVSGQLSDASLVALPGGSNAGSYTQGGTAYFDNYTITAVPEPGSLVLLAGIAAPALLGRRRQITCR